MATILVTDGDERAALAIVRSLGAAGHTVHVLSPSGRSLSGASKFAFDDTSVPDPLTDPEGYLERIVGLADRVGAELLLPVTEASLLVLLEARERLGDVILPFPSAEAFRKVSDKAEVLGRAERFGLFDPSLGTIHTLAQLDTAFDLDVLPYPVVLKPSRSVVDVGAKRARTGVRYARDAEALRREAHLLGSEAFPVLLQRKVRGPGIGVFLLLREGRVLAHFGHRRLREKPPSGGVSVLRESVAVPPGLLERSVELLRSFDWDGVAMIEYKVDQATGEPFLMEINGRFWGSLQLAIDAGVDFPSLLVDAWSGQLRSCESFRTGVRSRWFWGDVDHLLLRLRRSREELGLEPGAPGRLGAVFAFLTGSLPPTKEEVLRISDLRPGLRESARWFALAAGRGRRGDGGRRT